MELSPRHLQNIKFSRIQAGDPQIWSFSTVDLQVIFPFACIMLYIVYKQYWNCNIAFFFFFTFFSRIHKLYSYSVNFEHKSSICMYVCMCRSTIGSPRTSHLSMAFHRGPSWDRWFLTYMYQIYTRSLHHWWNASGMRNTPHCTAILRSRS